MNNNQDAINGPLTGQSTRITTCSTCGSICKDTGRSWSFCSLSCAGIDIEEREVPEWQRLADKCIPYAESENEPTYRDRTLDNTMDAYNAENRRIGGY